MIEIKPDPCKYYLCAIKVEGNVIYEVVRFKDKYAYTHSGYSFLANDILENLGEYSDRPKEFYEV